MLSFLIHTLKHIYHFLRHTQPLTFFSSFTLHSSAGDDDRSISSNNYQLGNGACADSMTPKNFQNLIDIPLSPLVEDYYQCTMGYWDSFVNSMGIATTNANNFASLIALPFFFSLWGLAVFFRKTGTQVAAILVNSTHDHAPVSGGGPDLSAAQQSGIN